MPFGIVLSDTKPIRETANFYVPSVTPSPGISGDDFSGASHILLSTRAQSKTQLLEELTFLPQLEQTTFLVKLPIWTTLKELSSVLRKSKCDTAIIVPINDIWGDYLVLRDYGWRGKGDPQLILELRNPLSESLVRQYKCLLYIAVFMNPSGTEDCSELSKIAAELIRKPASPALLLSSGISRTESYRFWRSISEQRLDKYSDMLIDPLQPLAVNMDLDVYETFEKDTTKYSQYENAIEMALSDLSHACARIKILVIGPGRGPLLQIVMKYARASDRVVAIEKNPKCHPTLARLCEQGPSNVQLLKGDVRDMSRHQLSSFQLVISELLGSFGCNEAAPEVLKVFEGLTPVMIPSEFRSYVQPIFTALNSGKWLTRPYLAKLNSFYPICKPVSVFRYKYPGENTLQKKQTVSFLAREGELANALYGYFDACLYGPYRIGIVPDLTDLEYCHSWYPMLFPIPSTKDSFLAEFTRLSSTEVIYNWTVNGNSSGENYKINLG